MKTNIKRRRYNTINRKKQKAMWKLLLAVSISALAVVHFMGFSVNVVSPMDENYPRANVVKAESITSDSKQFETVSNSETVEQTIRRLAKEANFKWTDYLVRLAYCESRLDPLAVNDRNNNPKHSKDRGLFQISDYWHKNVPDSVAFDVEASTKWAMDKINNGGQGIWVCNRYVLKNPSKYNPK